MTIQKARTGKISVRTTLPNYIEDRAHEVELGTEIWVVAPVSLLNNRDIQAKQRLFPFSSPFLG